MKIDGIQKLTLLDYPGKIACTIFTPGCNFRCPFCHNAEVVLNPTNDIDECDFFAFLKTRHNKLDGVCVSGGEPTLQKDLPDFLDKIHKEGFLVKLDTNGTNPELLQYLILNHLVDYVAMDVKNDRSRYDETCGVKTNYDLINDSIMILLNSSIEYEFRTTVVKNFHTKASLESIASSLIGCKAYYLQNFVDSKHLMEPNMVGYTPDEMHDLIRSVQRILPQAKLRGLD